MSDDITQWITNPENGGVLIGSVALFIGIAFLADLLTFFVSRWDHRDLKSFMVSFGIFGTFLGIFSGLFNFDTSQIEESVPQLLEGLKFAFATSILGLFASLLLSAIQQVFRGSIANDDTAILAEISLKLDKLDLLSQMGDLKAFGLLEPINNATQTIAKKLDQLESIKEDAASTASDVKALKTQVDAKQNEMQAFLESEFQKTNSALEEAIDTLSKGATEEIIKALEKTITGFNDNLKEQFGENFKQLNEAVFKLVEWQDNYKSTVEHTEASLKEIQGSLDSSKDTIDSVALRNKETVEVYEQIKSVIETFGSQIETLNVQMTTYATLAEDASSMFDQVKKAFDSISSDVTTLSTNMADSIGQQSESLQRHEEGLKKLSDELERLIPESLGELEKTLSGLTTQFADDYNSLLRKIKELGL